MRTYIIAAFTSELFRGNPAGVCILDDPLDSLSMQLVAKELQQPETAFVMKVENGWSIRWFSPETEVDLCGHATLAAASALWDQGLDDKDNPVSFFAAIGRLTAKRTSDGFVWLDFPALPGQLERPDPAVLDSVNIAPTRSAKHADRWLFEYDDAASVRALTPDFEKLRRSGARSLIVTAASDVPSYDIVSRNFAPIVGVDEDQVTGVAHTCLAPYWLDRLGPELRCWQASARGGAVKTRLEGGRVALGGLAVMEFAGSMIGFGRQ
jgi:predicted PhzF superfamily epimerase YddE/YHI9